VTVQEVRTTELEDQRSIQQCLVTQDFSRLTSEQHRLRTKQRGHHLVVQQFKRHKEKPSLNAVDRHLANMFDDVLCHVRQQDQQRQQLLQTVKQQYVELQRDTGRMGQELQQGQQQSLRLLQTAHRLQFQHQQVQHQLVQPSQLQTPVKRENLQKYEQPVELQPDCHHSQPGLVNRLLNNELSGKEYNRHASRPVMDLKSLSKLNQILLHRTTVHTPLQPEIVQSLLQAILDNPSAMSEKLLHVQSKQGLGRHILPTAVQKSKILRPLSLDSQLEMLPERLRTTYVQEESAGQDVALRNQRNLKRCSSTFETSGTGLGYINEPPGLNSVDELASVSEMQKLLMITLEERSVVKNCKISSKALLMKRQCLGLQQKQQHRQIYQNEEQRTNLQPYLQAGGCNVQAVLQKQVRRKKLQPSQSRGVEEQNKLNTLNIGLQQMLRKQLCAKGEITETMELWQQPQQ